MRKENLQLRQVCIKLSLRKLIFDFYYLLFNITMSGHSKWATIRHHKALEDKKRGTIFSKLSRLISIAAREGGGDPKANFKLRLVIEKAKEANMPKENIKRAIEKGTGIGGGTKFEEVVLEGYGPSKVAVIVETLTDNRNRTTAEVKNIFERREGKLAKPGAVTFQFKKMGQMLVFKEKDPETQILKLIDLGAEEVEESKEFIEVLVTPTKFEKIKASVEAAGFKIKDSELIFTPLNLLRIPVEKEPAVLTFLQELEEHDDISKVTANVYFKDR